MAKLEAWDDLDTTTMFWAGFISVLVFIVLVLASQMLYFMYNRELYEKKQVAVETVGINDIVAQQRSSLETYSWADEDKTKVMIPIDRAMNIVGRQISDGSK